MGRDEGMKRRREGEKRKGIEMEEKEKKKWWNIWR